MPFEIIIFTIKGMHALKYFAENNSKQRIQTNVTNENSHRGFHTSPQIPNPQIIHRQTFHIFIYHIYLTYITNFKKNPVVNQWFAIEHMTFEQGKYRDINARTWRRPVPGRLRNLLHEAIWQGHSCHSAVSEKIPGATMRALRPDLFFQGMGKQWEAQQLPKP